MALGTEADPSPLEDAAEIRSRALQSGFLVTLRGFAIKAIGLVVNLVVVRFVTPEEFGIFGVGITFLIAGTMLSDAGLAAALVRGRQEPSRSDLAAVQAFQLLVSLAIVGLAFFIGSFFGRPGLLVAVMSISLPLVTLRVPALASFERHLEYRPIVRVEIVETLAYSLFLIMGLVLDGGIWALAFAVVFRALVGTVELARLSPVGLVAPVPSIARLRPIIGFGAQFSGINAVQVVADQAFNAAITATAGLAVLGVWGVAYRLLQIPQIVFLSLRRVSYPAMARLIDTGEVIRPTIERTVRLAATASGVVLTPLIAASPGMIPLVFGDQWQGAADALPGACFGLMIAGPVSLGVASYLLAIGEAGAVLRAAIVRVTVMLTISVSLVKPLGVGAIGLGYFVAAVLEMLLLRRDAQRASGAQLVRALAPAVACGMVGSASGWILTVEAGSTAAATVGGTLTSVAVFFALSYWLTWDTVVDLYQLARRPLSRSGHPSPEVSQGDHGPEPT